MDHLDQESKSTVNNSLGRWLEIALIFLVLFVAGGIPVPSVNETHYLTKAKHYWYPDWCPGDLFLESADAHLVFYWTIGLLTKWFSLPTVAWIGRILAWGTLAWSWQRLSWRLVPIRWVSTVSAMLLVTLIERCHLAGEWVVGGVEAKCFAYVFVFGALAEMAVGQWRLVWPLLGLASAFHVLVGGWAVVCALAVWFLEPPDNRPKLARMMPSLVIGGLLALPGVIPGLLLTSGVPADIREEANQIYVFERLPHHLALHRLPAEQIARRFLGFSLMVAALGALCRMIPRFYRERDLTALNRIQRFAWASVVVCLVGLVWEIGTRNHPALSASLLKYYWYRLADIAVPIAVSLTLCTLFILGSRKGQSRWIIVLATLIPCLLILNTSVERYNELTPVDSRRTREALAWRDICRQARDGTPPDALFMVPRNASTFRWYAGRPVFFTWKDVPQDARSQVEWWRRYQEAYYGAVDEFGDTGPYGSLQELGADKLRQLTVKHDIDYVLTTEYPPLPLPVAFENPRYRIYDLTHSE